MQLAGKIPERERECREEKEQRQKVSAESCFSLSLKKREMF